MKGYWRDDGDGLSFTLWESKDAYDDFTADMLGQIDFMTHLATYKKKWRATAYMPGDRVITDWFTDKEAAIRFVDRETQLTMMERN